MINGNRQFKLLTFSNYILYEDRYLFFSIMNNGEQICFDIANRNSADEWDIINYSNKFIITRTISSYLTNKVWAWLDRGRTIWKDEESTF